MTRGDLQVLAEIRIAEATALLDAGFAEGAYYLAGYSVECALKACIAKQTNQFDFPDRDFARQCFTHDTELLLELAGLTKEARLASLSDNELSVNWNIVHNWEESSRYARVAVDDARRLVDAIANADHGVLAWLRLHW